MIETRDKQLRVAYLTGRYPAISHTFIMRELRALRELGVRVDTFSVWPTDQCLLLAQADNEEHANTYTLLPLRPASALRAHVHAVITRPRRYVEMLRRAHAVRRPGLRGWMLAGSWTLEAGVLWEQCRRRGIWHVHVHLNGTAPTVAMLTAALADDAEGGGRAFTWSMTVHGPSEFYDTQGERLAEKVRAATFVVCISDFARSQLMGLVEETHWNKLRVVHCGVDAEVFAPRDRGESDALRVLNVGRLVSVKGHGVLIEAIARLRERGVRARLTIIGEGPSRRELEDVIRSRKMESDVTLAGAVGQDEILDLYADADVFCMSSFAEGVPVVLMEAMAQEIPVVAPSIMGIPELVEHETTGLLTRPARADEIADALARLAAEPELGVGLGRAGREKVITEFSVGAAAQELLKLLEEYASP